MKTKLGSELKVGDTVKVWWRSGRDTIIALRPYEGPLLNLFPEGARIATFALCSGMTIDHGQIFEVVA